MLNYKFKKHILVIFFVLGLGSGSWAEGNLPYVDEKLIHFGFSLGINAMDFGIDPADNVEVSVLRPGFSVGIISDLRLNRYLNLRCTPTLHFGDRELKYDFSSFADSTLVNSTSVSSIPICIPIYLKYSAERKYNYRPYVIWGGGASFDLGTDQTKPILLRPLNFYTEFGVGCDIYFTFFKLAPELKFSLGFNDVLTPLESRTVGDMKEEDKKFTQALTKLTSRMLTLTFNFE